MKKNIFTMIVSFALLVLSMSSSTVVAKEPDYEKYIRVIDTTTQQEVDIDVKNIETDFYQPAVSLNNNTDEITKDVKIEFDIPKISGASLFSNTDTSKTHDSFYAYLKITYEKGGTADVPKVKVTSVEGYWKCTATSYSARFEDKEVIVKQGNWIYNDGTLVKHPSGDSFKYSTGWKFVDDLPKTNYSGVWAQSSTIAIINGMGGGYKFETSLSL